MVNYDREKDFYKDRDRLPKDYNDFILIIDNHFKDKDDVDNLLYLIQ